MDNLPCLIVNERIEPFSRQGINYLIGNVAKKAHLGKVNPHMLRHSCGFYLANKGFTTRLIQDYLGHKDIKHTTIYTRTASVRFQGLFD